MCHMRRRIHLCLWRAVCVKCHMRRRIHVSYEEEDTSLSVESERGTEREFVGNVCWGV